MATQSMGSAQRATTVDTHLKYSSNGWVRRLPTQSGQRLLNERGAAEPAAAEDLRSSLCSHALAAEPQTGKPMQSNCMRLSWRPERRR
jgi:hypothetical protein